MVIAWMRMDPPPRGAAFRSVRAKYDSLQRVGEDCSPTLAYQVGRPHPRADLSRKSRPKESYLLARP